MKHEFEMQWKEAAAILEKWANENLPKNEGDEAQVYIEFRDGEFRVIFSFRNIAF